MAHAQLAQHVHLSFHLAQRPLAFARVEEVDAQAAADGASGSLLLPVDGEGVEVVALEVHHGVELVHQSLAQPRLCVLGHGGAGIPATGAVARQVVVLTYWRARQLHPRLLLLYGLVNLAHDGGDVAAPLGRLLTVARPGPLLGVAYVVQVYAVDVVVVHNLAAYLGQVVARGALLGVHVAVLANVAQQLGVALAQLLTAYFVPLANGDGHHPGVTLHAQAVALRDGPLQRVVARVAARLARRRALPRLVGRVVERGGSHARLK